MTEGPDKPAGSETPPEPSPESFRPSPRIDTPNEPVTPPRPALTAWEWFARAALVVTLAASVVGVSVTVMNYRARNASDRRAAHDSAERRKADAENQRIAIETREAVRQSAREAQAQDSVRHADVAARLREQGAQAAAADGRERQRRSELAAFDVEMTSRVALLTDSLNAMGFAPTSARRPDEGAYYNRVSLAFQQFLDPRDRMSEGVQGRSTYEVLAS